MFTVYVLHDKSPELRAIRFSIEKQTHKDAIELYLNTKDTIVAELSIDTQYRTLDDVYIKPNDLA